jgi:hypothetical protein
MSTEPCQHSLTQYIKLNINELTIINPEPCQVSSIYIQTPRHDMVKLTEYQYIKI